MDQKITEIDDLITAESFSRFVMTFAIIGGIVVVIGIIFFFLRKRKKSKQGA
jgi:LPXTG-motif cell wall-anchored protein